MKNRVEAAVQKINVALEALNREATLREDEWVFSSPQQVAMFRSELERMKRDLKSSADSSNDKKSPGMGRVIADSWPLTSELGALIIAAEKAYESS
jgi:hypothetical protein